MESNSGKPTLTAQEKRVRKRIKSANDPFRIFFALFFLIGGLVIAVIEIINLINRLFPNWFSNLKLFIVDASLSYSARFVGVILFGLIGYLLLLFKKHKQFYYGLVESIVALVGLFFLSEGLQGKNINFVQFFAALYLCVRGFENVDKGMGDKSWPNTFASKTWEKLKGRSSV